MPFGQFLKFSFFRFSAKIDHIGILVSEIKLSGIRNQTFWYRNQTFFLLPGNLLTNFQIINVKFLIRRTFVRCYFHILMRLLATQ